MRVKERRLILSPKVEFKRGEAPLKSFFPLSFEGEGDKGGEVDK